MWALPFLWVILAPAVTVPATYWLFSLITPDCMAETDRLGLAWLRRCPTPLSMRILWPGVLNLVPAFWLLSSAPVVRRAALVAASLGAVRVMVPAVIYLAQGPQVHFTGYWLAASPSLLASLGLWCISVVALVLFALRDSDA